ncbi:MULTISPECIES: helicase-associated domain-containing protein [Streptomyces]|uniref:helicase-associated domain-containing protein n=1 Tax=Streptomyces TaxID=1883 RepID=UPI00163B9886|nr:MULTISPECIES: helicase C-terminal domain-containing protein [Streptomyces]MBC2874892.1 helicase-associated domain-containing protein [Streptomyces sp. TYQ1024]UBI37334.1 helicase C-terminal domain-containing protein [Streptomyces mobaraensis]UKW29926.1 helicase C-terminal domain-containing protein [Streptomyces sp. TYQ1024]
MTTSRETGSGGGRAGGGPRTLAEELRGRPDEALAGLLRARPDLVNPVPGDLTQLATRAATRASVVRALDRLDRFVLQVAEALAVAPDPCPYERLAGLMTGDEPADPRVAAELPRAVAELRRQALVWGGDDRLRLVRTARELLAPSANRPSATGLGPTVAEATAGMSPGRLQKIIEAAGLPATHDPVTAVAALTELFEDRARMAALLAQAPEGAPAVLERLAWGPPYGTVTAEPAPHLRWLLDRGLLLPTGPGGVVLPREAALHLRGGRAHRAPEPEAPAPAPVTAYAPESVDATAAGQAFAALAAVEELLSDWETAGPLVLRAGGLSVRDLKRAATVLDVPGPVAAFWAELAYAAGLLASDGDVDERYVPTPAYDEWLDLPAAERWAWLAGAWLATTRTPGLAGTRDAKGRTLSALGPDLDRSPAPEVRRRVLTLLAGLPAGAAVPADALLARLAWERPPRFAGVGAAGAAGPAGAPGTPSEDLRSRLARWALTEAELLGVTGRGALSAPGRTLLTHTAHTTHPTPERPSPSNTVPGRTPRAEAAAAAALAPLLPEPLDHVLVQADLTAVAPGPLHRPLAQRLAVLADIESKGGATVYRFTPDSVRRALDAGQAASDVLAFLTEHSRTPLPQPLVYLVEDVARRHGRLRVGAASSYLRCDDEATLAEILADRRSAALRLRRLAPTVLAAQAAPDALLEGLRAMGYAPAAESAEGDVVVTRADAHRTPPRTPPAPVPDGPPAPDDTLLAAAVRAVRAGDRAATAERKPSPAAEAQAPAATGAAALPRTTSAETLATMQAAVLTGAAVWMGYVNAEGAASQRVIAPVRVEGGYVTAYDHTTDEVRTFALHRVTGVAELAEEHAS